MSITIPRYAPLGVSVLRYDGEKSLVEIPEAEAIDRITVEIWFYAERLEGKQSLFADDGESGAGSFRIGLNGSNLELTVDGGSPTTLTFTETFTPGTWYYVAITMDGAAATLYVNAAVPGETKPLATSKPFIVGPALLGAWKETRSCATITNYFRGSLGYVRIWQGIIRQEDLSRLNYFDFSGNFTIRTAEGTVVARLRHNWRANEGYGDHAYDYSGTSNGRLGNGSQKSQPQWYISTLPQEPIFISTDPTANAIAKQTSSVPPSRYRHSNQQQAVPSEKQA
ncbi:MAG TPA: LamG domain-containing protein [Candidatus Kapabacteria bacterium]|nr:LamG domain-containing protein [Candidatus Kapabacteria bacterium]